MIKTNSKTRRTSFQLSRPDADSVALVGDFNQWKKSANPMKKDSKGVWKTEVKLPEGEYQFRYLVNGSDWENDKDCPTVSNSFHSQNSVVNIIY